MVCGDDVEETMSLICSGAKVGWFSSLGIYDCHIDQ